MVDLAFSTNAYTRHPLPEAIDRIAGHGYDGVELLADTPHAFFPEFANSDREATLAALDDTELPVSSVNANTAAGYYDDAPPSSFFDPSIVTDDDEDREWRIEYTKRAIEFADAVDAPAVSIGTGRPLANNPPEQAHEYLRDSLHTILDHAEEHDVRVGIEYEPELLVECTDEVLALIGDVGRDSLGVNLDLGHAAVYGEDPAEAIRQCAGHITGIHLEDIAGGRRGKHYHLVPGDGDLDFRAMFDALDDVDYDGFATLELYTYTANPDEAASRAADALAEFR
ncbi:sugar phosphate isomerase/epimerase family protein [Halococcus salsus]|uniref:sugar phosphate isomerase/epimerase family protein n=1 Tax=Halococcus salsus TaxID=2162894 RepID=UPI001356B96D|nr:sugar phosphate isomerase/epimerase family protein [Halococcus salsus]